MAESSAQLEDAMEQNAFSVELFIPKEKRNSYIKNPKNLYNK